MYSIYIVFNYPIHYKKLQMSVVLCLIKLKMYIISYNIVSKKKKKNNNTFWSINFRSTGP